MVDLYVALIVNGLRTIDKVPSKFRNEVIETLKALGLNPDGTPIV